MTNPTVPDSGAALTSGPLTVIDCGVRSPEESWPVDPNSLISKIAQAGISGGSARKASVTGPALSPQRSY
jgi:hypothetical protein